jgi:hypothetical protein
MSIVASELIPYCCINRPTDDTSTAGGAIADTTAGAANNKGVRPSYTQWSAAAVITFQSSSAGDTQSMSIKGRTTTGAYTTESLSLTGTTEKVSVNTYERILGFDGNVVAVGTITVRQGAGGTTRYTIPVGETGASAFFIRSASESGVAIRYDKMFWKNTNGALTLSSAQLKLTADPDARIRIGSAPAIDDSGTIANRKTTPSTVTFVDDNVAQDITNISGTGLPAGSKIGVWIEENLPASDPAHRSTFTVQIQGATV